MNMMRKTLTTAAVVASLGLLAACSKSEEPAAPPAAPAPSTTPTPAPVPPAPQAPQDPSAAPQNQPQSMLDGTQESTESAKDKLADAGQTVSIKAGELADKAGAAANDARLSVKEGATKADAAIQDSVGNGSK